MSTKPTRGTGRCRVPRGHPSPGTTGRTHLEPAATARGRLAPDTSAVAAAGRVHEGGAGR
ncbi:hypothetical protein [Streptomyces mirabilis]|uniref:hypothetical protein n=1 Tax=Streptomyces mirabilis TaxID=68239 RepID=UPI0011605B7D|nr:hypothetical protein [Streptomyces mirabilis]